MDTTRVAEDNDDDDDDDDDEIQFTSPKVPHHDSIMTTAKKKYPPLRPAVTLDVERQLPFDCTSGSNELWYSNDLLNNEHASHATTKSTPPQRPSPTKDRKKAEHPFTSLSGSYILLVAHDFDDRRKQG